MNNEILIGLFIILSIAYLIKCENYRELKCNYNICSFEHKRLKRFREYFDSLYGQGLQIANFHYNDDLEPFDNFYEEAVNYQDSGEENV